MSLLDYGADATLAASPRYIAPPRVAPEPKFSAWSAIPRGIGEAGAQVMATVADVGGALAYVRDASPEQRRQMDATGVPASAFSSEFGDSLRDRGRELRPDPQTAGVAEQLLYGFARGAAKIVGGAVVGGVPGVLAMGVEEAVSQSDDLRRTGVTDPEVRSKAGLVQGAGLAAAALPVVGQSLKATAALYLAGGPGAFVAQQALTRQILSNAGQDKLAAQYDPLDPVGLAVASLIPAGFALWGVRGQRVAAAKQAEAEFMAGTVPSEQTGAAAAVREAYSPEVVDAARVAYAVEARAASNPAGDGMAAMAAHETALARAEEQIARGEPVAVSDVAPIDPPVTVEQSGDFLSAKVDGGQVGGNVRNGELRISFAELDPALRGRGLGVEMYAALIDEAHARGLRVVSDFTVETPAARVYEALRRSGFEVTRNEGGGALPPSADAPEGALYGKGAASPVFSVGPRADDPVARLSSAVRELQAARTDTPDAPLRLQEPAAPQPQGKPRDLRAETIALRREGAVLQKLKECLA